MVVDHGSILLSQISMNRLLATTTVTPEMWSTERGGTISSRIDLDSCSFMKAYVKYTLVSGTAVQRPALAEALVH
jgi:hypothetical protein